MRKAKVLFFTADPHSAHGGSQRLLLDNEVREIRGAVDAATHRDRLSFDTRWATRTRDLLHALNSTHPQVVHFSGHGESAGLMVVSSDGQRPHLVTRDALAGLLEGFKNDVRLVVLNACFSSAQAHAIAEVVGCAIGTPTEISDDAAITFSAAFYSALAFGVSVEAAYNQARSALKLEHFEDSECPELVVRPGVDPSQLILIPAATVDESEREKASFLASQSFPLSGGRISPNRAPAASRRLRTIVVTVTISTTAIVGVILLPMLVDYLPAQPVECEPRATVLSLTGSIAAPAPASTAAGDEKGVAAILADAKQLCQVGNHTAAFIGFKQAADAGNAEAMGYLGLAYLRGAGTVRDPVEGIRLLRKAADARDPHAMNALGVAYQEGDGVDRSERWARHWFNAAADEKGYAESMRNLGGLAWEDGNDTLALAWYGKAADAGSVEAMVDIGLMYEAQRVKDGDIDDARGWYRRAARRGSARGMFALGRIYQEGLNVRQDYEKAKSWYLKAAEAGSADAMNNLGLLYQNGWGVESDRAEAIRWFRLAAAAGSTLAEANLKAMGERP
jgi:TPR repeat protein